MYNPFPGLVCLAENGGNCYRNWKSNIKLELSAITQTYKLPCTWQYSIQGFAVVVVVVRALLLLLLLLRLHTSVITFKRINSVRFWFSCCQHYMNREQWVSVNIFTLCFWCFWYKIGHRLVWSGICAIRSLRPLIQMFANLYSHQIWPLNALSTNV